MTEERKPEHAPGINVNVSGHSEGAIGAGTDIHQTVSRVSIVGPPTAEELGALAAEFARLRAIIEKEAPLEAKASALERIADLEGAADAKAPNVSIMAATRDWFLKHVPGVAGAVLSVIVHPTVGRIVQAAGEALAREYDEKFGRV